MKQNIFIISIFLLLGAVSCSEFLDVKSQGAVTQDHFFENDQQAIDAMSAVYRKYGDEEFLGREVYWEQACALDVTFGRSRPFNTLATLNYTGDEYVLVDSWEWAYTQGLNYTNWIIQSLLKKQESTELTPIEKRTLGEAYFMRGHVHFLIAYRYGTKDLGVPFVAYESVEGGYNNQIPEQSPSVMDDYAQIVSDLQKAEEILPRFEEYDATNRGRPHKAAAAAVMAKVYAYWGMWDKSQWPHVIECVNRLENSYGRDLHPSYSELFAADFDKFWTKEYCWGYPSPGGKDYAGGGGIEFPGVCLEQNGWSAELPVGMGYNGWGQFKPTEDIYQEMAKDNWEKDADGKTIKNERLSKSILEYGDKFTYYGFDFTFYTVQGIETGFQIGKYMDAFVSPDANTVTALDNQDWPCTRVMWPIVRFADCLLLRAEANLVAGNAAAAAKDINRIRERSHLKPIGSSATWTDLYHERRCELVFEMANDHAFDCKRWAISGDPEIKTLALHELNTHPSARHYADRKDPYSTYELGPYLDYQTPVKSWKEQCLTFPYPSEQIAKSAGKLVNPPSWQ